MARNRKRAKERRARRPQAVAAARAEREEQAPEPIEHATPDAELAQAQLAVGRGELATASDGELDTAEELDFEHAVESEADAAEEAAAAPPGIAEPRPRPGARLVNFVQGSWRELQRVQWPDRRQVIQATGVVIGFVIIAGVFLGVADFLAGKVMNFVLTGHFK